MRSGVEKLKTFAHANRQYRKVLAFAILGAFFGALVVYIVLHFSGGLGSGDTKSLYISTLPAVGIETNDLKKMDKGGAVPLLFTILGLLVGFGVAYIVRDFKQGGPSMQ